MGSRVSTLVEGIDLEDNAVLEPDEGNELLLPVKACTYIILWFST